MRISIVEDDPVWRGKIQDIVEKYCGENHMFCEISSCGSGEAFMEHPDADLLFLDIELSGGEDGFKIAEKLMDLENPCKVCFLTSHTEFARQGYKVNAFRYIDKRHLEEIGEALGCFFQTKIQERMLCCEDIGKGQIKINLKELLFVETDGRKLRYSMLDGREYVCGGQITKIAQDLAEFGFCHIQRSYIVNLKHIRAVSSREVTLCNGSRIAVGRAHSREFKKAFFRWRMQFGE